MSNKIKYPKISDDTFYKKLNKIYKLFKIYKDNRTVREICFPSKYKLQIPQKFVAEFINPKTPYKGLLVFHKIGSGKTCSAIRIGEAWKYHRGIMIVVSASLIGNFKQELRSECAGEEYISKSDRNKLKKIHPLDPLYKKIIHESDKKISKFYTIISYNRYISLYDSHKIDLNNTLLIIDEVQNMVSEHGTFYKKLYSSISRASDDLRVVILSATPMFDKPVEIALTLNLLRPSVNLPIGSKFNDMFLEKRKNEKGEMKYYTKNMHIFKEMIKGYVSYYRGAPDIVFPGTNIKYVKCKMSDYQYKSYKTVFTKEGPFRVGDIFNLPNNFFIGSRIISNIAFPKKEIGKEGFDIIKGDYLKMSNLKKYSIKFYKILQAIKKSEGLVFVYSNFKKYGGLETFAKILQNHGYKDYKVFGQGPKRFAFFSGDESADFKEEIKNIFSKKENVNGSLLKIILGSPAIKEGVTLLHVSEVHIIEPYWNISKLSQVMGRAVRFCSHKDLPKKDRFVNIYVYLATHPNEKTIDKYILNLARNKNKIIEDFEMALKEASVDCQLNKNINIGIDDKRIVCMH